jgi:hypothetical protein
MKLHQIYESWEDDFNPQWTPDDDQEEGELENVPHTPEDIANLYNDVYKKTFGDNGPGSMRSDLNPKATPEYYLIRCGLNEWIITDFDENVTLNIANGEFQLIKGQEILGNPQLAGPVSVVENPDPDVWSVYWTEGWKLTKEILDNMQIYFESDH